jgi:hypothetical protein
MAEALHTRKQGNSLALWIIAVVTAGVIFFGTWNFLNSQPGVETHPPGKITHSTPVGGAVLDGVYHPVPIPKTEPRSDRWKI